MTIPTPLTKEAAIEFQQRELERWDSVLAPSVAHRLRTHVETNNSTITNPDEIIRGQEIYTVVSNLFMGKLEAVPIEFSTLQFSMNECEDEGLVLIGCGGDLAQWIDGVSQTLFDEKIATSPDAFQQWHSAYVLTTATGDRTDIVLRFRKPGHHDTGKMALWRIAFEDASWWSDYVVNFSKHHNTNT